MHSDLEHTIVIPSRLWKGFGHSIWSSSRESWRTISSSKLFGHVAVKINEVCSSERRGVSRNSYMYTALVCTMEILTACSPKSVCN